MNLGAQFVNVHFRRAPLVWCYSCTLTIQVVKYLKAVLTKHNFASFTSAPVTDGPID
jgi:hypothetical protein